MLGVCANELSNVHIHLSLGKVVDMSSVCVVQGSKLNDILQKFIDLESLGSDSSPKV